MCSTESISYFNHKIDGQFDILLRTRMCELKQVQDRGIQLMTAGTKILYFYFDINKFYCKLFKNERLMIEKEFRYLVFLKEVAKNDIIDEIPKAKILHITLQKII